MCIKERLTWKDVTIEGNQGEVERGIGYPWVWLEYSKDTK